ncbi:MAG TPA: aminotransferase class III-fold pyridoxal phosphate-dependent enzyme [Nitrosopumilaceae archaeon]|nr:aminotransferase class III-fold pyridoxal phosphate-dependent enzyme [Nitrosopumilaceae archaeon]
MVLSTALEIYKKKTKRSGLLFAKSKKFHVNGVSHNIRFFEPYPFVTKSAKGKFLKDIDGNKYVDYWMGHWSLILGHAHPAVSSQVKKQLPACWMHGTVNEMTLSFSEIIQKAVSVAEKIRYVSSGTEATMYAVRIARAITGKKIIAKIDGGWHGYTTDLLKSVNWPFDQQESKGIADDLHLVSMPYNDLQKSLDILNSVKDDLAGVIIEPVLGGGGCIPATKEYLLGIQEFVHKNSALFLLDEIVTGFRFSFGCLYKTMGLDPDIVILGKIVGGGFPIGVICGKDKVMDIANTNSHTKLDRSYIGGGTFSANPITMTAGSAMLNHLKKNSGSSYGKLNELGEKARKEITKVFDGKVITTGKGSLFMTHFLPSDISDVQSAQDASKCDTEMLERYHFDMIANDGIFFLPGKLGAISAVHSQSDVKDLVAASQRFAATI